MKIKLADYRDVWKGRVVTVVGSGPTTHNYDWDSIDGPIFFLNDAISTITNVRKNFYFHTHHPEIERFQSVEATSLWIVEREYEGTVRRYDHKHPEKIIPVRIVQDRRWPKDGAIVRGPLPEWAFDKDYIAKSSTLLSHCRTITTVLHFLWFAGVEKILGIGIDPQYSKRHDSRISGNECIDLSSIEINQEQYLRQFEMLCDVSSVSQAFKQTS